MRLLVLIFVLLSSSPSWATAYFLSSSGSDSNNGTSTGTPWLTPNHALNCGDTISAATGTYIGQTSFNFGSWGTVTGTHPCVAFIKCATAFACTVNSSSSGPLMFITSPHWGVSGFVFTQTSVSNNYACIQSGTGATTDYLFFNNVFNGCYGGAIQMGGSDYVVEIANIAYNAAQQSTQCASGFPLNAPANFDTVAGTHIYFSQNVSWNNQDPNPCNGTTPTDGEGFIFDTWDANTYTNTGVMENNIALWNGNSGFRVDATTHASIYIRNNTSASNNQSSTLVSGENGEIVTQGSTNVSMTSNITRNSAATCCGGNAQYNYFLQTPCTSNIVNGNFGYSAAGNNIDSASCSGFSAGTNTFGTDPAFSSLPGSAPAAPSCSGQTSTLTCEVTLISNMAATAGGTSGLGYQAVSGTPIYEPLFPSWLCQYSAQLSGLVTMGCASSSAVPSLLNGSLSNGSISGS